MSELVRTTCLYIVHVQRSSYVRRRFHRRRGKNVTLCSNMSQRTLGLSIVLL